ncbi:Zinc finger BED domain-containing protein DAYSLEEPER [Abeliophyllum distichum]|uniref:Zinc finger BED domain-containing protein DAYSLEEPER n=1 Tax=Abeliophyllum distichum TaxID=126358 RepID=A0ABD1QWM7_9LAMI
MKIEINPSGPTQQPSPIHFTSQYVQLSTIHFHIPILQITVTLNHSRIAYFSPFTVVSFSIISSPSFPSLFYQFILCSVKAKQLQWCDQRTAKCKLLSASCELLHHQRQSVGVNLSVKGETIGKVIESCLHEWGIERVFTITVDNASADETAINDVKRKMLGWGNDGCILDGRYMHMRCCAHIVNLIVCEGLKEAHDSIVSIRNTVKYVKSSPARYQKLKECANKEKIECKSIVFLDVPTRWNSTYLMLDVALKFQRAFERLEDEDSHYLGYVRKDDSGKKKGGPPSNFDWENANIFVKFLIGFFDITLKFSTSNHVSSTVCLHEVCSLLSELEVWSVNFDPLLGEMATNMKKKFDKYWKKMENVNQFLLIAPILDPRYKLDYVDYCFSDIYRDETLASNISNILKENLMSVYDWYVRNEVGSESNQVLSDVDSTSGFSCVQDDSNSRVYRGFKSAFSTGGRILDPFRSSLSSRMVEVLVSTQNWFKASPNMDRFFMEDVEFYNKLDEELDESVKSNEGAT